MCLRRRMRNQRVDERMGTTRNTLNGPGSRATMVTGGRHARLSRGFRRHFSEFAFAFMLFSEDGRNMRGILRVRIRVQGWEML